MKVIVKFFWGCLLIILFNHPAFGQDGLDINFDVDVYLDHRMFLKDGLYEHQHHHYFSIAANPELDLQWGNGKKRLKASLFGRWDQYDQNRTHFDIRELYFLQAFEQWEWSVGWKKIFWGVTESAHLVDIINQTDQLESFDGEQKLGQPLVQASFTTGVGTFDLLYLPYARKRQFPSYDGRFRFPVPVERDDLEIDAEWGAWHPGVAFRWSHYLGPVDWGISHYYGVGREPLFAGLGTSEFRAFYPVINQTGLEFQATTGPVLWKLETIHRHADEQSFNALVAGFEYTFGNVGNTGVDIGFLAEYLYDSRDELALNSMDNDLFLGTRLAFNDSQSTSILGGMILDLQKSTRFFSIEGNRRFGQNWKVEIEARIFNKVSEEEFAYFFRNDSFMQLRLIHYF